MSNWRLITWVLLFAFVVVLLDIVNYFQKSGHNEFDERCVKLSDHMLTDAEYVENVECENTEVARSEVEEIARSEGMVH